VGVLSSPLRLSHPTHHDSLHSLYVLWRSCSQISLLLHPLHATPHALMNLERQLSYYVYRFRKLVTNTAIMTFWQSLTWYKASGHTSYFGEVGECTRHHSYSVRKWQNIKLENVDCYNHENTTWCLKLLNIQRLEHKECSSRNVNSKL